MYLSLWHPPVVRSLVYRYFGSAAAHLIPFSLEHIQYQLPLHILQTSDPK